MASGDLRHSVAIDSARLVALTATREGHDFPACSGVTRRVGGPIGCGRSSRRTSARSEVLASLSGDGPQKLRPLPRDTPQLEPRSAALRVQPRRLTRRSRRTRDAVCERGLVLRSHDDPSLSVDDDVSYVSHVGSDTGKPAQTCLDEYPGEPLGSARKDEQVSGLECHARALQRSGEAHSIGRDRRGEVSRGRRVRGHRRRPRAVPTAGRRSR